MNGYLAFFNGKQIEVYADSLYRAKLKALEILRPPKSKRHMVTVMLAEKDDQPVVHIADF